MRVAVAGATGVIGTYVAAAARDRGHTVVPLSRSHGVDLRSSDGVAERLEGVDAVVDVTSTRAQRRRSAERFFGGVTQVLLAAEQRQRVPHHLALSIIGIDEVPTGYYRGKLHQEQVLRQAPTGWSLLRAAQVHEFAEQALDFARLGRVSLVPRLLSRPVAAAEVAHALVDLAEAGPSGRVPDLAGPEQHWTDDLARRVVHERGLRRRVVGVRVPGAAGRAVRRGALCGSDDAARGTTTFEEWLAGVG